MYYVPRDPKPVNLSQEGKDDERTKENESLCPIARRIVEIEKYGGEQVENDADEDEIAYRLVLQTLRVATSRFDSNDFLIETWNARKRIFLIFLTSSMSASCSLADL